LGFSQFTNLTRLCLDSFTMFGRRECFRSYVEILLSMYNPVWAQTSVPVVLTQVTVIPVLKLGIDRSLAISYRPISLTGYLWKTMDRMVNRRLCPGEP
jgi:hypothetical protein